MPKRFWNFGKTTSITVPIALAPILVSIARSLDESLPALIAPPKEVTQTELKEKLYEILDQLESKG
jgi:hypothetical protein